MCHLAQASEAAPSQAQATHGGPAVGTVGPLCVTWARTRVIEEAGEKHLPAPIPHVGRALDRAEGGAAPPGAAPPRVERSREERVVELLVEEELVGRAQPLRE